MCFTLSPLGKGAVEKTLFDGCQRVKILFAGKSQEWAQLWYRGFAGGESGPLRARSNRARREPGESAVAGFCCCKEVRGGEGKVVRKQSDVETAERSFSQGMSDLIVFR